MSNTIRNGQIVVAVRLLCPVCNFLCIEEREMKRAILFCPILIKSCMRDFFCLRDFNWAGGLLLAGCLPLLGGRLLLAATCWPLAPV